MVGKLKDGLTRHGSGEQVVDGEITMAYTKADRRNAPDGHMPLPYTDLEVVAYPANERDLVLLVNKAGVCVFRCVLAGALRLDLDVARSNLCMREQRVVLDELPNSLEEVAAETLRK